MIQFNLLPNVKLEYVKTKRNKRLTIIIATLVAGASLSIFVILLLVVQFILQKNINDLSKDIKIESSKLSNVQDLNKILTIQNQLNSLTTLHDDKPVATRLFGYLKQLSPNSVSMANLNVDFDTQAVSITGSASSISAVNTFVDTLKFTTYKVGSEEKGNAFSDVVLAGFGKDTKGTSYQLTFKFDKAIFDSQKYDPSDPEGFGKTQITLNIPQSKITTRSETEKPGDLFEPLKKPKAGE